MSTHANIVYKRSDGVFNSIFVWHDGYVDHLGSLLFHHVNGRLAKDIATAEGMSSLNIVEGIVCGEIFYTRDEARIYGDEADFKRKFDREEYNYMFDEASNKWYLMEYVGEDYTLVPLETLVKKDSHQYHQLSEFFQWRSPHAIKFFM